MSPSRASGTSPTGPSPAGGDVPGRADTWPGPSAPWTRLLAVALIGALVGGLLGLVAGLASGDRATASATVQAIPDARALAGPLDLPPVGLDDSDFIAAELAWLDERADELATDDVDLSVTQVGTSDALRFAADAPTADEAQQAVTALLDAYVTRRQEGATAALDAAREAVIARIDAIGGTAVGVGPVSQEIQRLLGQQSALEAAAARVPGIVPVLRAPAEEQAAGVSPALTYTVLGAVLGAVLALAGAALWRVASPRVFDARLLVAAGAPVLLPRLPAGSVRTRADRVPEGRPNDAALAAARLLAPQLLDVGTGALLVIGVDEKAGAAEVAWELAWALTAGGTPVALLTTGVAGEREPTPGLTLTALPADAAALEQSVTRHRAAGRLVLLHAPALATGLRAPEFAARADQAVVVVGEGVSTLEAALAAVRDVSGQPGAALAGVAVTTAHRHGGTRGQTPAPQESTPRHAQPAGERAPAQQDTVSTEA
ncbi:hypothetical protein [Modestobacter roseus]|uniref:hypothetical protein n=1 Tax=Modestobacter roseus TaxID=1181884 RepID=UPI0034DF780E